MLHMVPSVRADAPEVLLFVPEALHVPVSSRTAHNEEMFCSAACAEGCRRCCQVWCSYLPHQRISLQIWLLLKDADAYTRAEISSCQLLPESASMRWNATAVEPCDLIQAAAARHMLQKQEHVA